jgi:hypothetical protein
VTLTVGDEQLHPGIFIKKIDMRNHNVVYTDTDCLILCLNEVTGRRIEPIDIRKKIWPDCSVFDIRTRPFHTRRHIKLVCGEYDVNLQIYNVVNRKCVGYNKSGSAIVQVAKLGQIVGLLDRIEEPAEIIEEEDQKYSLAYFDLETVQKESDTYQRIYAYSIKSENILENVCYHDVDVVEDCLVRTIIKLLKTNASTTYLFAWNGSRFDARIITPILKRSSIWVGNIIVNGANELLSAVLKYGRDAGTAILRDPCKLFPAGLNEAAQTFGLKFAKTPFDHDEVELYYVRGGRSWEDYVSGNSSKIRSYVKRDVELLEGVVSAIKDLYDIEVCGKRIPFAVCFTRSMASGNLWSRTQSALVQGMLSSFPQGPYDEIKTSAGMIKVSDLMPDLLAARVQAPFGRVHETDVLVVDAKSMYPSRASLDWYPCGPIAPSSVYVPEKLGMYRVRVSKQKHPHVLPYRTGKGYAYDWNSSMEILKWVTSVDVRCLIEGHAEFEILSGFVWESKTREYFKSYMDTLYELRKVAKSSALDLHFKILMNALLGSLIQDQFREYTVILTKEGLTEMQKKYGSVISVMETHDFEQGHLLCVFKPIKLSGRDKNLVRLQNEVCKSALVHKPGILTWFVLSYARYELLRVWKIVENLEFDCRMVYCDTDSLIFTNSDFAKFKLECLGLFGKELGQWEVEYEHAEIYVVRPKFYALKDPNGKEKVRIKGVKQNAYCRTGSKDEYVSRISAALTFDEKSKIYAQIKSCLDKKESFGPRFEHVKDVYDGESLEVVDFQMHKHLGGIMKKYVVSEFR